MKITISFKKIRWASDMLIYFKAFKSFLVLNISRLNSYMIFIDSKTTYASMMLIDNSSFSLAPELYFGLSLPSTSHWQQIRVHVTHCLTSWPSTLRHARDFWYMQLRANASHTQTHLRKLNLLLTSRPKSVTSCATENSYTCIQQPM